jgi:hypothetical protein
VVYDSTMAEESPAPALEIVARLLARLSHRFADREAILWRQGHDEDSWATLEERALARVRDDLARGETSTAAVFARAFSEARAELGGQAAPNTIPGAKSAVPSSDDAVPTLPRYGNRVSLGTTMQSSGAFIIDAPTTSDDDPFAVTMSSNPREDGKSSRK